MKERLNIYLPDDLLKRVREQTEKEERTLSAVVERALRAYIKEKQTDGHPGRHSRQAR